MMNFPRFPLVLLALSISACGGGGGSDAPSSNNTGTSTSSDLQSSSGAGGIILGSGSGSGSGSSQSDPAQEPDPITNFTVTWIAPAQREDGMPISLSDIAGYKVYTGTAPGFYTENVSVDGSDATSKIFVDFAPGSYFICVTTLDTEGRESQFSDEIEIVVAN